MTATPTEEIISGIETEEQALEAISSLRAKFDMRGTEFTREDIKDAVDSTLSEAPEDVAEFLASCFVQVILDDPYWKRLPDVLSERGNEVLGDAAADACGLLASVGPGLGCTILVTSHDADGAVVTETTVDRYEDLRAGVEKAKHDPGATKVAVTGLYREQGWKAGLVTVWTA